MAYVAEWRLQRAHYLLAVPNKPVKAIAHAVGYQSAAAFTRAFAERFGAPPKEIRQRLAESA